MLSALTHKREKKKGAGGILEAMNTLMALTVMLVSQVYTCLQTHHVVYIKHLQLYIRV